MLFLPMDILFQKTSSGFMGLLVHVHGVVMRVLPSDLGLRVN
jgi:hypothetical protein